MNSFVIAIITMLLTQLITDTLFGMVGFQFNPKTDTMLSSKFLINSVIWIMFFLIIFSLIEKFFGKKEKK